VKTPRSLGNAINFRRVCPELGAATERFYRSGSLSRLEADEARGLRLGLGIRNYVDLRSDEEVRRDGRPDAMLEQGVRWWRCPITDYPSDMISRSEPSSRDYVDYYLAMMETARDAWMTAVDILDTCSGSPLVFGCSAGKDRTGLLAAVVLDRVGAPRSLIAGDFARSGAALLDHLDRFQAKWEARGLDRGSYARRMQTPPDIMLLFLAEMDRRFGGLGCFLGDRRAPNPA
jgi:hypothetical protein